MIAQDEVIAYATGSLEPGKHAPFEAELARDPAAQRQLADQQCMDQALRVILGGPAADQQVKQSVLAVVRGMSVEQLRAEVLAETTRFETTTGTTWAAGCSEGQGGREASILHWVQSLRAFALQLVGRPMLLGLGLLAAALVIAIGAYRFWNPAPQPEIGSFTSILGTPTLRHASSRASLVVNRAAVLRLGDRIQTGDADKAEIQFQDGTTVRLNFNTVVEIPKLKSQISNSKSALTRPPEVKLLAGQLWTKVTKAVQGVTPAPFAVRMPAATATVKGTEFGLKLLRAWTNGPASSAISLTNALPNSASRTPPSALVAVLTVREGAVEFANASGSVQATAMTESVAQPGTAPTPPKRLQTLEVFHLTPAHTWVVTTTPLSRTDAVQRLVLTNAPAATLVPGPELGPKAYAELSKATRTALLDSSRRGALAQLQGGRLRAAAQNNLGVLWEIEDRLDQAIPGYQAACHADSYVPLYHLNLGLALRKVGNFERAAEELELVRKLVPKSVEAHERLADVYSLLGRDVEAFAMAEAASKLDPLAHGAWELKSQLYLKQVRPKEALEAALKAIELKPDCGVAYGILADVYHNQRLLHDAEQSYRKAVELEPEHPALRLNLGNVYRDENRLADAEQSYRQAIALRPDFALAYHNLGNVLSDRRQLDQALQSLRKAVELDPEDPGAYRDLAEVYLKRRQFRDAEKSYQHVLQIQPDRAEAYYGLGEVYRAEKKYPAAEQMYLRAGELKPDYADPEVGLGLIRYERRQFEKAEKYFRSAIELDPSQSVAYHDLGELYREVRGQFDEAERYYRKSIELSPNDAASLSGLAIVMAPRNIGQAEKLLRRAVALEPDSSAFHNNLGEILRNEGKLEEAERFYRKALELDPEDVGVYCNLGILQSMRGQPAEAEKTFRSLLDRASPSDKLPIYVNLASACGDQGKLDEAENLFRQALVLGPDDPHVWNSYAWFLADHRLKLDEALDLSQRAVKAAPKDANNLDTLGWVHFQRGELAEAEATLNQALALAGENPPAPDVREHLKKVYEKKGATPK